MPEEITALIVDDHEVVRQGLRLSLSRAPHIRVVGEASDGAEAVGLALRRKPQVVIMDVRMPGMDGLEATRALAEQLPETKVLLFTAYSERSLLGRGFESGAKGYVLKEAPHETLVRAIERVAAGGDYVDPALMPQALAGRDQTDMLTAREREILQLLADGMSNADVAEKLFISQETVKSHVRHILTKLEADTRTQAVAIALREAMIDELAAPDHDVHDRLIIAEQDERRRLALFLHDGPVQELSGIALMLDGAIHAIAAGAGDQAQEIISSALLRQRATIRELRDLSFALEPVVLRDSGFEPALRALADQTEQAYAVRVDLDLAASGEIGQTASIALYTILREVVDQAIRRGPPTEIAVRVAQTADGSLLASVSDDAEPERRRRSIEAIEERTHQLHGTVEVNVEGSRSEIRVTLPAHTRRR